MLPEVKEKCLYFGTIYSCCCLVTQSSPTLSQPHGLPGGSLPGSSVHGISQAKILNWIAISSSKGSSPPRDQTHVSWSPATAGEFFTTEPTGNPMPMFFLLDPLSLRAIKRPRDVATHTEYITIKTCTGVSVSWGPQGPPT